jgi:hypothetical protein
MTRGAAVQQPAYCVFVCLTRARARATIGGLPRRREALLALQLTTTTKTTTQQQQLLLLVLLLGRGGGGSGGSCGGFGVELGREYEQEEEQEDVGDRQPAGHYHRLGLFACACSGDAKARDWCASVAIRWPDLEVPKEKKNLVPWTPVADETANNTRTHAHISEETRRER